MADKIQMVAADSVHITAVGSEPLKAGDKFEVDNEADAKRLEAAGHKRAEQPSAARRPAAKPK